MAKVSRRKFLETAVALGAAAAWGGELAFASTVAWRERRDLFPEGVASGDPDSHSVLLWTRRAPIDDAFIDKLHVEVAEDEKFERVVASADAPIGEGCRLDLPGFGGRTRSRRTCIGIRFSPTSWAKGAASDARSQRQTNRTRARSNLCLLAARTQNQGAQNAYRRMIFEDKQAPAAEQIGFILHLGDFIYEIVWYPERSPQGMYDRKIYDVVHYPDGEKHEDFHIPTNVDGYRAVYRGYLKDPDLQDARAHGRS